MIGLIFSAAVLATVMLVRPDWLAPGSRPEASAAWPLGELLQAPEPRVGLLNRRRADKGEVARQLFRGELSLLEAAERFYHLNGGPPGLREIGVQAQPGGDDGERLCNQAISWAETVTINDRPRPEVEARLAALRRMLQEHVAIHGGVDLPAAEVE
jgi:hypothetical protein